MLVNLIDVMSVIDKEYKVTNLPDMQALYMDGREYSFLPGADIDITLTYKGNKVMSIAGNVSCSVMFPCDRCLNEAKTDINFDIERELNLKKDAPEYEEYEFINESTLDLNKMINSEVILNFPVKVLCKEACSGICSVCGQVKDENPCNCDNNNLDPRMSVISDIFKNFKGV